MAAGNVKFKLSTNRLQIKAGPDFTFILIKLDGGSLAKLDGGVLNLVRKA